MELICPVMVLYIVMLGAICMEEEAASNIRRQKTCPVETFQAVMKIPRGDVTMDFCPIKSEPLKDNMESSQLPSWLCFKDECRSCGNTEPLARCFVRVFLFGLTRNLMEQLSVVYQSLMECLMILVFIVVIIIGWMCGASARNYVNRIFGVVYGTM